MTTREYLVVGAALLVGWILISRPLSRQEAARHRGVRTRLSILSLAVVGACVWFFYYVKMTHCGGAC